MFARTTTVGGRQSILVSVLPRPDLQVSASSARERVAAGGTASVEFTVINQGNRGTTVPNWTDRVYLSLDDKVTSDDILVATHQNGSALLPLEEYRTVSSTFDIPKRFRGTVYVIVSSDHGNAVDEWPNDANNIKLHELYVEPLPFADLVVSEVTAPAQAFEGNEVTVRYTVTNLGSGPTDLGRWTEQVWLTRDKNRPHPGQGDILLTTLQYEGGILAREAGYDRQVTVQLPASLVSGTYYIMPWVDPMARCSRIRSSRTSIRTIPANITAATTRPARSLSWARRRKRPSRPTFASLRWRLRRARWRASRFTVTWTVQSTGQSTAAGWVDEIYLANAPTLEQATRRWSLGYVPTSGRSTRGRATPTRRRSTSIRPRPGNM
jgi:hypothetical protein